MIGSFDRILAQSPDGLLWTNTQAMCISFKKELMLGAHQLGSVTIVSRGSTTAPTADTVKAALYTTTATVNAQTTSWAVGTPAGEVSGTGYTNGGVAVTAGVPTSEAGTAAGGTAWWTPGNSIVYTTVTLTTGFDAVLLYNSTQANRAMSVHTFGSQTVTAGTFTLSMPADAAATALLRLA